jgi:hypothetical protein
VVVREGGGDARADELGRAPLGVGAAEAAPTAPHATPRPSGARPSGPERFWSRWPLRVALAVSLIASCVVHCSVLPFGTPPGFELNDVDGEAAIPVDLLAQQAPEPPPPPPPPEVKESHVDTDKDRGPSLVALRPDAGPKPDSGARDGSVDAMASDASVDARSDAAGEGDAGELLALVDGGLAPRDPEGIVGAVGSVQADVVLVMVVVNAEVIRENPVGARMGYLLRGIPQWDEFMSGTEIDPVRDTDWVLISGPSLINTSRDVVLIHYSAPDAVVDKAVSVVARKYDKGGPYDAGVRGVRATRAHADQAERILMRAQPHVLAVVPPQVAEKVGRQLVSSRVPPHVRPGEAVYLRLVNPHHPMPEIPESVTEMRLRVVPRPDEGADVFIDGDTKDAETAAAAATVVRQMIRRHNDAFTSLLTHGLLDHAEVAAEGSVVKVHVQATRDHIETLVALVGGFLGVEPPPAASGSAVPAPLRPPGPAVPR